MNPDISPVNIAVEGMVDEAVIRRVLQHARLPCGRVYGKNGKPDILKRLRNYNAAAVHTPWLVVVDLDRDEECAPPFVSASLTTPANGMRFRVAVRAIEAWLMADAERLAAFLSISPARIPVEPDTDSDPKTTLVNLARRSRKRAIREYMVPREGSGMGEGPGYSGSIIEFVTGAKNCWRPEVARLRSPSLRSCLEALGSLKVWRGS